MEGGSTRLIAPSAFRETETRFSRLTRKVQETWQYFFLTDKRMYFVTCFAVRSFYFHTLPVNAVIFSEMFRIRETKGLIVFEWRRTTIATFVKRDKADKKKKIEVKRIRYRREPTSSSPAARNNGRGRLEIAGRLIDVEKKKKKNRYGSDTLSTIVNWKKIEIAWEIRIRWSRLLSPRRTILCYVVHRRGRV